MLNPRAARLLCVAWATLVFLFLAAWAWHMTGNDVPHGPDWKPQALDFDAFWSAAHLAVQGHARQLYDNHFIEMYERAHTTVPPGYFAFYYPPMFLLLCLPLALAGYLPAMLGFVAVQAALLMPILKRIVGRGWGWLPVLVFPGFLVNVVFGQNGGLTAACFGGGLLLLERRPLLAGACLGALAFKPQLAATIPVALLAARRGRALVSCAATGLGFAAMSFLVLGQGAWAGFFANAPLARTDIETLPIKWPVMQSVYAGARLAGAGLHAAYLVHGVVAAVAVALLVRLCWRRPGGGAEISAAVCTALLFTPFLYIYDLTVLGVPTAWYAGQAAARGWRRGEKPFLLALYVLTPAAYALGLGAHVIVGPVFVLAFLVIIYRGVAQA
jgi:hypothetical protein